MDARAQDAAYVKRVEELIGADGLAQAYSPIEDASGLPNAAYWSEDWLALEQERIFRRGWVFAGVEAELAEPGAMKPIQIGGAPIVIVRGDDSEVRGFHNVCRHRGARLVGEPCRKPSFTCPYHAWNYGLDGKLRARPHFQGPDQVDTFEDGGGEKLDLVPVRIATWNGCIFTNVSGTAPEFDHWMAPFNSRAPNHDFSSLRWAGRIDFEVRANWKLIYENYIEGYHVFSVHPRLLRFAPMKVRWSGEWDEHFFYNDYVFPKLEEGRGEGLPHYPGLSGDDAQRGFWVLGFPHFAAEIFPDQFAVLASYPVAPDLTREELHVFLVGDAATSAEHQAAREAVIKTWDDLNREDLGMLELLQQGRKSPAYDGGRLSPHWEGPTHQFGRRVIEAIIAA